MAYCEECGKPINHGNRFCSECGTPQGFTDDIPIPFSYNSVERCKMCNTVLDSNKTNEILLDNFENRVRCCSKCVHELDILMNSNNYEELVSAANYLYSCLSKTSDKDIALYLYNAIEVNASAIKEMLNEQVFPHQQRVEYIDSIQSVGADHEDLMFFSDKAVLHQQAFGVLKVFLWIGIILTALGMIAVIIQATFAGYLYNAIGLKNPYAQYSGLIIAWSVISGLANIYGMNNLLNGNKSGLYIVVGFAFIGMIICLVQGYGALSLIGLIWPALIVILSLEQWKHFS